MLSHWLIFYQKLPLAINPVALKIGFFSVNWYSLMYLIAFFIVYGLLKWRIKNDFTSKKARNTLFENLDSFFIHVIIGLLAGARLGYILFYEPLFFWHNPLAIISPFNFNGELVGIYGLSYHGGLLGALLAGFIFARKNKIIFWKAADFLIPAIPAGYFFGRLGNFFNGELYGRVTEKYWGMYFWDENYNLLLRHPSQLYEAFFEGIVLFIIFWTLRNNEKLVGRFFPFYLIGYGFFRFFIEFFRQPDAQIGLFFNFTTLGQIFSLGMISVGICMIFYQKKARRAVDNYPVKN